MKKLVVVFCLALQILPVAAEQPAGPSQAFIDSFPGGSSNKTLVIGYCLCGSHMCVERIAMAWGQVCDSDAAKSMGTGESGEVRGFVPWGFHYAGWRCGAEGRWHDKSERVFGGGNWGN